MNTLVYYLVRQKATLVYRFWAIWLESTPYFPKIRFNIVTYTFLIPLLIKHGPYRVVASQDPNFISLCNFLGVTKNPPSPCSISLNVEFLESDELWSPRATHKLEGDPFLAVHDCLSSTFTTTSVSGGLLFRNHSENAPCRLDRDVLALTFTYSNNVYSSLADRYNFIVQCTVFSINTLTYRP